MASPSDKLPFVDFTHGQLSMTPLLQDHKLLKFLSTAVIPATPVSTNHELVAESRCISTDEETHKTNKLTKKGTSKRQVYRLREKCKRMELRGQVAQLSEQLAQLIRAKELEQARFDVTRSSSYLLWKEIADRQRDDRLNAEAEQRQLVVAVNSQAEYMGLLRKRVRGFIGTGDVEEESSKKHRTKLTEAQLIDAYIRELDENYAKTDEMMANCGLSSLPQPEVKKFSAHTRDSDGSVEYFEQISRQFVPFPLEQTHRFFWELGWRQYADNEGFERHTNFEDPENSYAAKFLNDIVFKTGMRARMQQRLLARRFVRDQDVVFVWKFVYEGEGAYTGMHMVDTAWCIHRPSIDSVTSGTSIEMCIHRLPLHFTGTLPPAMNEFHETVQEVSDDSISTAISILENLLLDDVLEGLS